MSSTPASLMSRPTRAVRSGFAESQLTVSPPKWCR